ncbi:MAG: NAD(P)/FAD-dependent oxidoreductase, partial [Bacilli bacterium]
MKKHFVMIGNGMAGVRAVEEMLKIAPDTFKITIFGKEPHTNYNRIKLSNVLQGEATYEEIVTHTEAWYNEHNITLYTGEEVCSIDTKNKTVTSEKRTVHYDELLIATGSLAFELPIPGKDLEGITAFRDIKDTDFLLESANSKQKAVVIGAGVLGLEAAKGLMNLGMDVTVVHLLDSIMERQLDTVAAKMLQRDLEAQGMKFLLNKKSVAYSGETHVTGIQFADGDKIDADVVLLSAGIIPNRKLAEAAQIAVNRGVLVDDFMRTSEPNVYAVGECVEHDGIAYGL